jgi:hypothetical protein
MPEEALMHLMRKPYEPTYVALVLLSNPIAAQRYEQLMGLSRSAMTMTTAVST